MKWTCEVGGQLLIFNADNTVTDNSAMTASVVRGEGPLSHVHVLHPIDTRTRSMGVAMRIMRPAVEQMAGGRLRPAR